MAIIYGEALWFFLFDLRERTEIYLIKGRVNKLSHHAVDCAFALVQGKKGKKRMNEG